MDTKTKIYLGIGSTLLVGGTAVILTNRTRGNSLYDQWTVYGDNLHFENNVDKQSDIALSADIFDLTKKYTGAPAKYIKTEGNISAGQLAADFHYSMAGGGTDTKLFYATLYKIKNLYTFAFINKVYELSYGEKLTDAILSEAKLSGTYSNATSSPLTAAAAFTFGIIPSAIAISVLSNKLNPTIINYLSKLPEV